MKTHLSPLAFLLTLLLCPQLYAAPATLDLVYIGDSITAATNLPGRATQAPPVIATQALQKQLGSATTVYMVNMGHSGFTTVNFLPNIANPAPFTGIETAATALQSAHPGQLVFSIMLGTNDSANSGPKGAPISADDYAKNLQQIIDKLLTNFPTAKFVINHPIWHSPNARKSDTPKGPGSDYGGDSSANRIKSYFPAIDTLIAHYASTNPGHVYLGDTQAYDYFAAHTAEFQPETGKEGTFYLHPNPTGAATLGTFWSTALAEKLNP